MRKIIHLDMDCFYAAVEIRDNPSLAGKPVAVGGAQARSVVATCNYEARRYGIHSAMSGMRAKQLCPQLIFIAPNFDKYRSESKRLRAIMAKYTRLIEPLSLDEAYLDVSHNSLFNNSATLMARALKEDIYNETGLRCSAGVAPNKFLAKVASDWDKPDGLVVISPPKVADFVRSLPLSKIPGVGEVTNNKLKKLGWSVCGDLQKISEAELCRHFGKFGSVLHQRAFGRDERPVVTERDRKSLSVETTFNRDLNSKEELANAIEELFHSLEKRLEAAKEEKAIDGIFVKVKFDDFTLTTKQARGLSLSIPHLTRLAYEAWQRQARPVRLLGVGVDFASDEKEQELLL